MYSVMIVDDDVAVRATLKNIIDWNAMGFEIVAEEKNGKAALERLKEYNIQLLITDMKMPVLDGLELVRNIQSQDIVIIALSAFGEYELVREAFKLGIDDYLLKIDIEEQYLTEYMQKIKVKLDEKQIQPIKVKVPSVLDDYLTHTIESYEDNHQYVIIAVDLSDEQKLQGKFREERKELVSLMKELVLQIPTMIENCEMAEDSECVLLLRYHSETLQEMTINRVCEQLFTLVKNFMNVELTIATTDIYQMKEQMSQAKDQVFQRLDLRYVFGEGKIFPQWSKHLFDLEEAENYKARYAGILDAFRIRDNEKLLKEEGELFQTMITYSREEVHMNCLHMIYLEGEMLKRNGDSMWNVYGMSICFQDKLARLMGSKDYVMWMYNFNRFLFDYLCKSIENKNENSFEIIRRYILENYSDMELNIAEAASMVGLNENYFSTKFKKEVGCTFSDYLKQVRMKHAKELMETTNLKIYEISQAVGYRNVEHFTRVFKSSVGVSPKQYMR